MEVDDEYDADEEDDDRGRGWASDDDDEPDDVGLDERTRRDRLGAMRRAVAARRPRHSFAASKLA